MGVLVNIYDFQLLVEMGYFILFLIFMICNEILLKIGVLVQIIIYMMV